MMPSAVLISPRSSSHTVHSPILGPHSSSHTEPHPPLFDSDVSLITPRSSTLSTSQSENLLISVRLISFCQTATPSPPFPETYQILTQNLDFFATPCRKGLISLQVLTRPLTTFDLPQNTSLPLRKLCIEMLSKDAASRPSPHRAARALGAAPPPPPAAGSSPNKGNAASPPNRGHAVPTPPPQREAQSPGGPAGTDKYAGKIADFRRKTPAATAAARGPGGIGEREKKEVEYHRLESTVDWKPTARRRAGTQADVAAALKTAGVGR